jgi:hypothetical protein
MANAYKPRRNDLLQIHYVRDGQEYSKYGMFRSEDEEYFYLLGTVGDEIGHTIMFPKKNVLFVEYNPKDRDEDWS